MRQDLGRGSINYHFNGQGARVEKEEVKKNSDCVIKQIPNQGIPDQIVIRMLTAPKTG